MKITTKIFIALFVFFGSFFMYSSSLALDGEECYECVVGPDGAGSCNLQDQEAGYTGCSEGDFDGDGVIECESFGELCNCPSPSDPCVA